MYTVIWTENSADRWDRFETADEVVNLLKELERKDVCVGDVWIFKPNADNYASAGDEFLNEKEE